MKKSSLTEMQVDVMNTLLAFYQSDENSYHTLDDIMRGLFNKTDHVFYKRDNIRKCISRLEVYGFIEIINDKPNKYRLSPSGVYCISAKPVDQIRSEPAATYEVDTSYYDQIVIDDVSNEIINSNLDLKFHKDSMSCSEEPVSGELIEQPENDVVVLNTLENDICAIIGCIDGVSYKHIKQIASLLNNASVDKCSHSCYNTHTLNDNLNRLLDAFSWFVGASTELTRASTECSEIMKDMIHTFNKDDSNEIG